MNLVHMAVYYTWFPFRESMETYNTDKKCRVKTMETMVVNFMWLNHSFYGSWLYSTFKIPTDYT